MFINTMAVGPLEPGVTCFEAMDALPLLHCEQYGESSDAEGQIAVARVAARENGTRSAMVWVGQAISETMRIANWA